MILLVLISACSSKDRIIPTSDKDISEVYHNQTASTSKRPLRLSVNTPLKKSEMSVDAYTLHNIKKTTYQYLPNPTLYMYVNYKLTEIDRSPVPAFITEFKMYEREEYALPSEININWGSK